MAANRQRPGGGGFARQRKTNDSIGRNVPNRQMPLARLFSILLARYLLRTASLFDHYFCRRKTVGPEAPIRLPFGHRREAGKPACDVIG